MDTTTSPLASIGVEIGKVASARLVSTAVVAAIGAGEAFERGRDFGAWLGLVPHQYSTCGRSILGRISKRGSKYLRTLFIQAANVTLMRPHNWARFSFGTLRSSAAPRLHRNKPATAVRPFSAHYLGRLMSSFKPARYLLRRPI